MTPIQRMQYDIQEKLQIIVEADQSGKKDWEFTMLNEMDSIIRRVRDVAHWMKKKGMQNKEKEYTKFQEIF